MSPPNITDQSHKNNRADIEMFFGESSEFSDSETTPDDSLRKSEQPEVINGINTLDNLEREFYMKFAKYVLGYTCGNCMCCKEIKLMSKLFEINSIILGHRKSIENHDSSFAAEGPSTSSVQIMKNYHIMYMEGCRRHILKRISVNRVNGELDVSYMTDFEGIIVTDSYDEIEEECPSNQSTIEKENVSCQNKNEVEELQILQSNDDIFDQNGSTNLNKTSSASKKRGKKRKTIDIFKPKIKKNSNKHVAEKKQSVNKQIELASTSDDQSMDEVQNGTSETISKQKNLKQGKKRKSATIYKGHVKKKSNKSVKKAYVSEINQCNDEEIEFPNKNMPTELNEANNHHFNEILEELRQKRASKLLEEKENSQNTSLSITTSDQKENISDTEDAGARGETLNLTRRKDSPMSKDSRQKLDFSSPNLELTKKKRETQREKAITSNRHNSRGPLSRKKSPKNTSQKRKPLYSPENWLNSNDFSKMCASV